MMKDNSRKKKNNKNKIKIAMITVSHVWSFRPTSNETNHEKNSSDGQRE